MISVKTNQTPGEVRNRRSNGGSEELSGKSPRSSHNVSLFTGFTVSPAITLYVALSIYTHCIFF